MAVTASDGLDLLRAAGLAVEITSFADAEIAGRHARLRTRKAPPSPSTVAAEREDRVVVVYVVPRLTESLQRMAADDAMLAVVATEYGIVWWDKKRYELGRTERNEALSRGKAPWARFGLLRALLRTRRPRTQAELAAEVGVTQAAMSQNLKRMREQVHKSVEGWALLDPNETAEHFMTEYPGPGGITQYWFGIDPVMQQARSIQNAHADTHGAMSVLLSGDAGADLMAPWRAPRRATVYARSGLQLARLGFAESSRDSATLAVTVPADKTIWALATAFAPDGGLPATVDPLLCAHDVKQLGGSDADQAAERLVRHTIDRWSRGD